MMPVRNRARDDVHGCTSVAVGIDAESDRPVCEPQLKTGHHNTLAASQGVLHCSRLSVRERTLKFGRRASDTVWWAVPTLHIDPASRGDSFYFPLVLANTNKKL